MSQPIGMGAMVAIIKDRQILLTKREDFEVWCMPGGMLEAGESLVESALREAQEETGLTVELTGLLGMLSRIAGPASAHLTIFNAEPICGMLTPQEGEVIDMGYFGAENLPDDMIPWHRQPSLDALNGVTGAVYTANVNTPLMAMSRKELYELRDRSGLSRVEMFRDAFEKKDTFAIKREL